MEMEGGFSPVQLFAPGSGVSNDRARNKAVDYIVNEIQPESVLDLGCGVGMYGYRIRLFDKDVKLTGVDISLKYLASMFCQSCYNTLIQAKIEEVVYGPIRVNTDLTIMMSTIEHFKKPDAETMLKTLDRVIVSTPMFPMKQPVVDSNRYQEHRCWFKQEEIEMLGYELLFKSEYPGNWPGYCGVFQKGVEKHEDMLLSSG